MAGIARKVGSKDSRFLRFRLHTSLCCRARALSAFIEPRSAEREETEGSSRSLSPFAVFARGEEKESRIVPPVTPFHAKVEWDSDAILDNGKLEDLVRLALKRLNVSYLTILSRLVWFQRETLVCYERGRKRNIRVCFLEFLAIKFYHFNHLLACSSIT